MVDMVFEKTTFFSQLHNVYCATVDADAASHTFDWAGHAKQDSEGVGSLRISSAHFT